MANNKNQKPKNYVAAAMGIAAGAMIYKKTHTACGQCGSKISGKQYKIKPHGEDERVAASLAGVNPHKRYDAENTIRKVAAVCGGDTVTNLKFDRDESREWKASGTICRSDDKRHKANSGKTRRNK